MSYFFGPNTASLQIKAMRYFPSVRMIHSCKIPRMSGQTSPSVHTFSGKAQSIRNVETTWPLPAEHERNWQTGKLFDLFMSVHQFAQCNNTLQTCGSEDGEGVVAVTMPAFLFKTVILRTAYAGPTSDMAFVCSVTVSEPLYKYSFAVSLLSDV
jgi:hypothetical protein